MNAPARAARRQDGLTLVEIMVALVIGLMLVVGTLQIFSANQQTYRLTDAAGRLQEDARFVMETLINDVRAAAFQGCVTGSKVPNVVAGDVPPIDLIDTAIQPYHYDSGGNWQPAAPAGWARVGRTPVPGTDVIVIQRGGDNLVPLAGDMAGTSSDIVLATDPELEVGELVLIADCDRANIFRASAGSGGTTLKHATDSGQNTSAALSKAYNTTSSTEVMRFLHRAYFVSDTGRTTDAGDRLISLYQFTVPRTGTWSDGLEELVEGVEHLRLLYGQQISNAGDFRYVPATDGALDPGQIISVQLGALLVSPDRVLDADLPAAFSLLDLVFAPNGETADINFANDRRLRRPVTTTVAIRNRRE